MLIAVRSTFLHKSSGERIM